MEPPPHAAPLMDIGVGDKRRVLEGQQCLGRGGGSPHLHPMASQHMSIDVSHRHTRARPERQIGECGRNRHIFSEVGRGRHQTSTNLRAGRRVRKPIRHQAIVAQGLARRSEKACSKISWRSRSGQAVFIDVNTLRHWLF